MNRPPISEEQLETIRRWRSRQIMAVAIGNLAAIVFLVGIAVNSHILPGLGLATFLFCLGGIFLAGFLAHRATKSRST